MSADPVWRIGTWEHPHNGDEVEEISAANEEARKFEDELATYYRRCEMLRELVRNSVTESFKREGQFEYLRLRKRIRVMNKFKEKAISELRKSKALVELALSGC